MSHDQRYERVIDAPPGVVFDIFTTPGGQEAFYGEDDPSWLVASECDLRVGGLWTITFGPAQDQLYRHSHRFQVIDRPQRLVMATTELRPDGSALSFTTAFTFADHDGRTLMTMIQTGLPTADLGEEHTRGLPTAFDRLERAVRAAGSR